MKILINEKLSEHKYKTPEGYLVCVDSILARTGKQTYRRNELFHDGDETEVEVDRTPEEVFSEATLASFENKPVTVEHPDEDVNVNNYKEYAVGFVRDVKRGFADGQDVILGTLVITDAQTIEEIENGEHTDLSCGYDCDILDEDNPSQKNIRGNHVALCQQGRAGIAKIVDSVKDSSDVISEMIEYLGKRNYAHMIETDEQARAELKRKFSSASNEDIERVIRRWHTGKLDSVNDSTYCVEFSENGQVFKTWIEARDEKEAQVIALHANPKARIRNVYRDSIDSVNDSKYFFTLGEEYTQSEANEIARKYGLQFKRGRNPHSPDFGGDAYFEGSRQALLKMIKGEQLPPEYKNDIEDAKNRLSSQDRKFIANYLRMISTYTSRDVDIKDLLRPLSGHGFNWTIEKIDGWKWREGEYAYKDYYVSINGYDDRFLVTLYADPNQDWKVKEVNAYFTDSVDDSDEIHDDQHIELVKGNHERDQILAVYQSDIDENLYFYVGKKYCMKDGAFSYNKYLIKSSPQAIMRELEKNGWHKVNRGPAPFIDSISDLRYSPADIKVGRTFEHRRKGKFKVLKQSNLNEVIIEYENGDKFKTSSIDLAEDLNGGIIRMIDSVNDSTYKCEFNLNEDTMWTYVKANSPEDAKREILDKFANAKNISVTSHDSVEDAVDLVFKDFVFAVEQCLRKAFYKLPPIHEHQWSNSVEIPFDYSQKNWIPSSASIKNFLKNEYGFNVKVSRVTSNWAYEKEIIMTITMISKVSKDSVEDSISDASRGHEIVVYAENYLSKLGKNNSVGKYDKIIFGVKSLLEKGFLQGEDLKRAVEREVDRLLKQHGLDSVMKVVSIIKLHK